MRSFAALALLSSFSWWGVLMQEQMTSRIPPPLPALVEFKRDIQPIFERHCQPCHFPGGKMHARLPFDRPETIATLGTRVFSRIKKGDERLLIERFLAQQKK